MQTDDNPNPKTEKEPIRIWTSCFSRAGNETNAVAISRGVPRGWRGRRYLPLAPTWEMLRLSDDKYSEAYDFQISLLNPVQVAEELAGSILLCFESRPKDCHRLTVGNWLKRRLGESIIVEEWESAPTPHLLGR